MKNLKRAGLLVFLIGEISAFALPGQLDTAFINTNLQVGLSSLLPLPDGRVVVGFNNTSPVFNGTNVGAYTSTQYRRYAGWLFAASDTNKYTIYNTTRLIGGNLLVAGSFTNWAGRGPTGRTR